MELGIWVYGKLIFIDTDAQCTCSLITGDIVLLQDMNSENMMLVKVERAIYAGFMVCKGVPLNVRCVLTNLTEMDLQYAEMKGKVIKANL